MAYRHGGSIAALALLSPAASLHAQTDILVTANKRPERAQDVPASLWVASGVQLDRAQIHDFDDLVQIEPSLTITKSTQPANNSINIRGVGTYAFSIATRPSVSVIVDDGPQPFQAQAFRELADMGSIEVLRGPSTPITRCTGSRALTSHRALASSRGCASTATTSIRCACPSPSPDRFKAFPSPIPWPRASRSNPRRSMPSRSA